MFEEFMGIPVHPLLVHAAVVFLPLQVAAAFAYAIVPFVRRFIAWLVVALAVIAPLTAYFAKLSGDAFRARLIRNGTSSPELLAKIDQHSSYGRLALYSSLLLALIMVVLVAVALARSRQPRDPNREKSETSKPGKGSTVLALILAVGVIAVGGATAYYVFKTGDSGARMVWTGL